MLSQTDIDFIKDRLVKKFKPKKILLFGSQARGEANYHSDVDLLILMDLNGNRKLLTVEIDNALRGFPFGTDIVILSQEEFEHDKTIPGTIARYAFLEGKVLYESIH